MKNNSIWKYNKRSGLWDHQRNVEPDTKDQWLDIYKKDEPDAHFHVSKNKPKHNPTVKENLAGAGTSDDGGMSAPFSAKGSNPIVKQKPKSLPKNSAMGSYVDEDAPVNAVGTGTGVAGLTPNSLPGRPSQLMPMVKRGKPFLGVEPYIVPSRDFNQIREAKRKGKHWRTYLDEDDAYHHIRMEAKKNKKGAIIIEDENTGALCYVKYGKNI